MRELRDQALVTYTYAVVYNGAHVSVNVAPDLILTILSVPQGFPRRWHSRMTAIECCRQ